MQSKIVTPRFMFVVVAIFLAAISRVLPHPANFTPIAAMALFAGAFMADKRLAFVIPLLAMFLSDCLLQLITGYGFHNTMVFVYGSFCITVGLGFLLKQKNKAGRIILLSILSSCIFFVLTNFATWWLEGTNGAPLYQHTWQGLVSCYVNAIPYFQNELLGNLCYCGILFGSFYFAKSKFPVLT